MILSIYVLSHAAEPNRQVTSDNIQVEFEDELLDLDQDFSVVLIPKSEHKKEMNLKKQKFSSSQEFKLVKKRQ